MKRIIFYVPIIALVVLISLFAFTSPVSAQGEVPPADIPAVVETQPETTSESAVEGEEPSPVEIVQEETNSDQENPAESEEQVSEEPSEQATDVEELPVPEVIEESEPPADITLIEETQPLEVPGDIPAEIIPTNPDSPELVVIDQVGEALPLASEQSGEALIDPDPYFFVGTTKYPFTAGDCDPTPGVTTPCDDPIQAAFDWIRDYHLNPTGGAVYVEASDTAYNTNLVIDGLETNLDGTSKWTFIPSNLALIGVLAEAPGVKDRTIGFSSDHIINGSITVTNMKSFTLQAFTINGNVVFEDNTGTLNLTDVVITNPGGDAGLFVTGQNGPVNLNQVEVTESNGAYIDNTASKSAAVSVKNSSFQDNDLDGLVIYANGLVTLTGISATNNAGAGVFANSRGLTVRQAAFNGNTGQGLWVYRYDAGGSVSVQNAQFNNNGFEGALIEVNGNVEVKNSRASNNGWAGLYIDTCDWDEDPEHTCANPYTGNVIVSQITLTDNVTSGNSTSGLVILARGTITVTDAISRGNGDDSGSHQATGAYLENDLGPSAWGVNVSNSIFEANSLDGVDIYSKGVVTLKDIIAYKNGEDGVYVVNSYFKVTAGVSILNSTGSVNEFNENKDDGLVIFSNGAVVVNASFANKNLNRGIFVNNSGGKAAVTIDGVSGTTANENEGGDGVCVLSSGLITIKNMDAEGNANSGFSLDNSFGTAGVNVLVTLSGWGNALSSKGGDGLTILTNGAVTIQKTHAGGNLHYGAYIDNSGGTGSVTITDSSFNGNANMDMGEDPDEYGLYILSRGAIALTDVYATWNGIDEEDPTPDIIGHGAYLDNDAAGSAVGVTITRGYFYNNIGDGLIVETKGNIILTNVEAHHNTGDGAFLNSSTGTSGTVTIKNTILASFSNNGKGGLRIYAPGAIIVNMVDASYNEDYNSDIYNGIVMAAPVTISNSYFNNNQPGGFGLQIGSNGNVSLLNVQASGNYGLAGVLIDNRNSGVGKGSVTVACTAEDWCSFNDNGAWGLSITSNGAITLKYIEASGNDLSGAEIDNSQAPTPQPVTIISATFHDNKDEGFISRGLHVLSKGNITLTSVYANGNGDKTLDYVGDGIVLDNCALNGSLCTGVGSVILTNVRASSNHGNGIDVKSYGAITLYAVTANDNSLNGGTYNNLYSRDHANPALPDVPSVGGVSLSLPAGYTFIHATYNGNGGYGLSITSNGAVSLTSVTVNNNAATDYGTRIDNTTAAKPLPITITRSFFNNNSAISGIQVFSKGAITFTNNQVIGNLGTTTAIRSAAELLNKDGLAQNVTVANSIVSRNDGGSGLFVWTNGNVTLTNITANENAENGLEVYAAGGKGTITINGVRNSFNDNVGDGVNLTGNGVISITNVVSEYNIGSGITADNCMWDDANSLCQNLIKAAITITNAIFNQNGINGINAQSTSVITLNNVDAFDNGIGSNGHGAFLRNPGYDVTVTNSAFMGNEGSGIHSETGIGKTLKLIGTSFCGNNTNDTDNEWNLYNNGYITVNGVPFANPL